MRVLSRWLGLTYIETSNRTLLIRLRCRLSNKVFDVFNINGQHLTPLTWDRVQLLCDALYKKQQSACVKREISKIGRWHAEILSDSDEIDDVKKIYAGDFHCDMTDKVLMDIFTPSPRDKWQSKVNQSKIYHQISCPFGQRTSNAKIIYSLVLRPKMTSVPIYTQIIYPFQGSEKIDQKLLGMLFGRGLSPYKCRFLIFNGPFVKTQQKSHTLVFLEPTWYTKPRFLGIFIISEKFHAIGEKLA